MTLRRRRPGLVYPVNEDWIYVGDTGEPDWYDPGSGDAWENASSAEFGLAFRLREAGIVDIEGNILATSDPPSNASVFQLPVRYRPSSLFIGTSTGATTGGDLVPIKVAVYESGFVGVLQANIDPYPVPGGTDALASVALALQVFLTPSSAP